MSIASVVTAGFGNGTFDPGVALVPTRGYSIGAAGPSGEFSEKAVQATIFNYFATNFSNTSNVEYDEEPFDPDGKTEWVQLDVTVFDSAPRRKNNLEFQRFEIVANCWAKNSTNTYRCRELADAVVALFSQQYMDVQDFDVSGDPVVGGLNVWEGDVVDLTRQTHQDGLLDWQHMLVTFGGQAQET